MHALVAVTPAALRCRVWDVARMQLDGPAARQLLRLGLSTDLSFLRVRDWVDEWWEPDGRVDMA